VVTNDLMLPGRRLVQLLLNIRLPSSTML